MYEWMHLQMAKQLEMMALDYRFVRIIFNGKDLGIYAVEENFDKELPFNNKRTLGPVFRFDPDAFWEYRLLGHRGFKIKPEYTEFQSAFIDPMRSWSVEDSVQQQYLEEALILMNAFREQKASASKVFELELFARRYALLDLIGGFKSVDWSDLKFYYNPLSKKIEPIAYESFSGFRIKGLIGFGQFQPNKKYHGDFHSLLFSDPSFYRLYYQYLEEFSPPGFIDNFLSENDSAIAHNIQIINNEFPYKRFDRRVYDYNAKVIQTLTHPRYPLHVFVSEKKPGFVLKVGNVSALPVEVLGVWREDEFFPVENKIIAPKLSNGFVEYHEIEVAGLEELDGAEFVYRLWGNSEDEHAAILQFDRPPTAAMGEYPLGTDHYFQINIGRLFDINGNTVVFRPGQHVIDVPIIIPDSMELLGFAPLAIYFKGEGQIISKNKIRLEGTEDNPITISSEDGKGGFVLLEGKQESLFKNVNFDHVGSPSAGKFEYPAHITVYRSLLRLEACLFKSTETLILSATDARINIVECNFYEVTSGVHAEFSEINIDKSAFAFLSGNALSLDASKALLTNISIVDCNKKALNFEKWSNVSAKSVNTTNCNIGVAVKSGSVLSINDWKKEGNEIDIDIKSKTGYGVSKLTISDSEKMTDLVVEKDEESVVLIND
jgi:hypothetical protein